MAQWRLKDLFLGTVILLSAATIAIAVSVYGIPHSPCTGNKQIATFTITADLNGYNDSKNDDGKGPLVSIQTCDKVVISLANHDIQSHGLSVDFYSPNGIEAVGGDTVRIQFQAYKSGTFRIFCNTLCSVHKYMQHAQLTVECTAGAGCA